MTSRQSGLRSPKAALIGFSVAIVVAIAALALWSAFRDSALLDPSEPGGVVQAYLDAMSEGDPTAHQYLSPQLQAECPVEDLSYDENAGPFENQTLELSSVEIEGDTATVEVKITTNIGGLFGTDSHVTSTETYSLRRFNDTWRLSKRPWPIFSCSGGS